VLYTIDGREVTYLCGAKDKGCSKRKQCGICTMVEYFCSERYRIELYPPNKAIEQDCDNCNDRFSCFTV